MTNHNCIKCKLRSELTKSLSDSEFNNLVENSVTVSFKKGDLILKQNAFALNIVYIKSGLVKTHISGPYKERIHRILKAPSFLGIPTTFGDRINNYSATAIADTTACFFDASLFKELICQNGYFAYDIIENLCKNELLNYNKFTNQLQKQIPGLVAEVLLCFSNSIYENNSFELPLTRSELGDLIGTSRESVSRVLTDFSNENLIKVQTKNISILKKDVLMKISEKG
jgi:CRP/FNR family transcriptional regulator